MRRYTTQSVFIVKGHADGHIERVFGSYEKAKAFTAGEESLWIIDEWPVEFTSNDTDNKDTDNKDTDGYVAPAPGWFNEQVKISKEEAKKWPEWMGTYRGEDSDTTQD